MDSKTKYLIFFVVVVIIGAIILGYKNLYIDRNYILETTTTCDPLTEVCFQWCENGECDTDYYKKVTKNAHNIPFCDSSNDDCPPLACESNEKDCLITLCSGESLVENEVCTNPEDFVLVETATPISSET